MFILSDLVKTLELASVSVEPSCGKDILMIPEGIIKINKEKLERSVSIQYITGIIYFQDIYSDVQNKKAAIIFLLFF